MELFSFISLITDQFNAGLQSESLTSTDAFLMIVAAGTGAAIGYVWNEGCCGVSQCPHQAGSQGLLDAGKSSCHQMPGKESQPPCVAVLPVDASTVLYCVVELPYCLLYLL